MGIAEEKESVRGADSGENLSSEMKNSSRFHSLRRRINFTLSTGTSVVALGATLLISFFFVDQLKEGLEMKARSVAALLADNLGDDLGYNNDKTAAATLAGLKEDPEFTYAAVYKVDGTLFVELGQVYHGIYSIMRDAENLRVISNDGMIHVVCPIYFQKEIAGRISIGFSTKQLHARSSRIRIVGILSCTVLTALLMLYFSFAMNRTVIRPIRQLTAYVQKIGEGDLRKANFSEASQEETREIHSMRETLSWATESFRGNVRAIQQASSQFARLADGIIAVSSQLSDAAGRQVDGAAETFTTSKRMETTGRETADIAQHISRTAETSVQISGDGLNMVKDSVGQFHSVREQVQTIVDAVEKMNSELSQVDAIIQSVSDVARQSQLLAINASVEAAKAGEAGLRFAVVAREIKQMSAEFRDATDSVRQTLSKVQNGIHNIAEASEDGRKRTVRGMESIETTGKVISRLAGVINSTAEAARRITVNANKQVDGLKDMSASVFQIDDLSKGHLDAVRQIENYGEKLNSKAEEMERLVSKFRIG